MNEIIQLIITSTGLLIIACVTLLIYFRRQVKWLLNLQILILKSLVFDKDQIDGFSHIRILGDSIAFGLGSNNSDNTFYGYFKKRFDDKLVSDHSDIGSYLRQLIRHLKKHQHQQNLAVVWAGSMDILFGFPRHYHKKFAIILNLLCSNSQQVIIFSPPDACNLIFFPKPIRKRLSARSKKFHLALLEEVAKFPNAQIVALYPEGEVVDKKTYLANDMIHPNQHFYRKCFLELDKLAPQDFDFTTIEAD